MSVHLVAYLINAGQSRYALAAAAPHGITHMFAPVLIAVALACAVAATEVLAAGAPTMTAAVACRPAAQRPTDNHRPRP